MQELRPLVGLDWQYHTARQYWSVRTALVLSLTYGTREQVQWRVARHR